MHTDYEVTIGLETHIQLKTKTKMFCGCAVEFSAEPNSHTCPICLGYPGALPSINRQALIYTVEAGLLLNCKISPLIKFDRKNYFYPDMPKNYQITQVDYPVCLGGYVEIQTKAGPKKVNLTRIHLEEDVAKLTHHSGFSGIDYNRAGIPLMEIVSEPDMCSAEEVQAYLNSLKEIMVYAGISNCNLEEGNMRSDVNISVKPKGQTTLGTKVEIKNMNTFSGIQAAINYEVQRQTKNLENGTEIHQETRRWDPEYLETQIMRTKENAEDYRYFNEPDLIDIVLSDEEIEEIKRTLCEPAAARRVRLSKELGLTAYEVKLLCSDKHVVDFFEATTLYCKNTKLVSTWILSELLAVISRTRVSIHDSKLTPKIFGELLNHVDLQNITTKTAKELLDELYIKGGDVKEIIKSRSLGQINDLTILETYVAEVLVTHKKVVEDFKAGKQAAFGFLIGQVMKLANGKASPQMISRILNRTIV